jgi:hypothetical protein
MMAGAADDCALGFALVGDGAAGIRITIPFHEPPFVTSAARFFC